MTAALSLCLLIQTPQENAQQRLLSLAEPPANHSSGMQGAFRLYPTPKYERERGRERERDREREREREGGREREGRERDRERERERREERKLRFWC